MEVFNYSALDMINGWSMNLSCYVQENNFWEWSLELQMIQNLSYLSHFEIHMGFFLPLERVTLQ